MIRWTAHGDVHDRLVSPVRRKFEKSALAKGRAVNNSKLIEPGG
jgi:hypothetical protein